MICDELFEQKNPRSSEKEYKLLKYHSLYYADINLSSALSIMNIFDNKTVEATGVYYSLFLACSPRKNKVNVTYDDYSKVIFVDGEFSYFNSNSYLSADEFYTVDLYLFLSLIYCIFAMYWIYMIIIFQCKVGLWSKYFTIIIPIIILEKLMTLQIYSEMNRSGNLNVAFEAISIICNVIKNVSLRIILYGISIGYNYTVQ